MNILEVKGNEFGQPASHCSRSEGMDRFDTNQVGLGGAVCDQMPLVAVNSEIA